MFKLRNGDSNAGITVVEEPREVVRRIGHLDTKSPELANLLMSLDPDQLQGVGNQVQTALVRVGVPAAEMVPQKEGLAQQVIRREVEITD